jgi:hypothetical protein
MRVQSQPPACLGGEMELFDCPFLTLGGLATQRLGREAVERHVIGRMHCDQLALQMRRKLGDLDAGLTANAGELVAIILALGRLSEIDAAAVPGWNLDTDITGIRHPARGRGQSVERRGVAHELGEENRRTLHATTLPDSTVTSRFRP